MPKPRDSVPSSPSTDIKAPPSGTAATDTMAATRPSREALLLGKIHHDNQAEIELANLAKQNSSSDAVKKFADRIVADHSKADEQVVALAQSKNIDLHSGPQMSMPHQMRQDERQSKAAGSPTGEYAHSPTGLGGGREAPVDQIAHPDATL